MKKRLPDEREAMVGAGAAVANAAGLLGDADLLADAGSYGTAVAMAVLGLEEAVKARTLGAIVAAAAVGTRPGFSEEGMLKIIYGGHRERHSAAFFQHVAAASPDIYGAIMLGMPVGTEGAAMLGELAEVLGGANAGKQAGLYTDFDPDSGSWSSPRGAGRAEFVGMRPIIGSFITETQRQFDEFSSCRPAEI